MERLMLGYFSFSPASPSTARGETQPIFDWAGMVETATPGSSWTLQEALLGVLFSAAVCDGSLDRVEQDVMLALIHRSRALKSLDDEELEDLNASISAKLHGRETECLEEACKVVPVPLRLPIFAQALDIILADGDLTQRESAFLNRIAAYLQLAEADVQRVAEVIILKNTV
jgi:uncharacterized tellurite resistance protein B-like protein